jgi:hypothetical protein
MSKADDLQIRIETFVDAVVDLCAFSCGIHRENWSGVGGDPNKAALLHAEALELTKILGRSAKTARSRRRESRDPQSPNRAIPNR